MKVEGETFSFILKKRSRRGKIPKVLKLSGKRTVTGQSSGEFYTKTYLLCLEIHKMKVNNKNKEQRMFLIFILLVLMTVGMMLITSPVYADEEPRQEIKPFIIGTEFDYPPYSFLSEAGATHRF